MQAPLARVALWEFNLLLQVTVAALVQVMG